MESILEIKNLSKNYSDFNLDNVNINIEKGFIMGFIGPNGAGKTTTIKLIMNLIKRNSGEIKVLGLDNINDEKEVKNRIGFVYDECNFYDNLTLRENAKLIADFYSKWSWNDFDIYMTKFGLSSKQNMKLKEMSKGMKTKFFIATSLSHDAELLIMDEPTSGLDPVSRQEIINVLQEYIEDGNRSILFSTHILSDIEKMADYITFINKGKIVFSDEKTFIEEKYRIVKGGLDILDNAVKKDFIEIKKNKFGFSALVMNSPMLREKYGNEVVIDKPSIEDIMLYMAGDKIEGEKNE